MVRLRLKRMGSKYNPFYRIVAADARSPRDGRFIEEIGYYNPHSKEIKIDKSLRDKWLSYGAVPSNVVRYLFSKVEKLNLESNQVGVLPKKPPKTKSKSNPKKLESS